MNNLSKFIADNRQRMQNANLELLASARAVIPTLKDAGRPHAAKDIEEKVFMIDSIQGEISEYFKDNTKSAMADMKELMGMQDGKTD